VPNLQQNISGDRHKTDQRETRQQVAQEFMLVRRDKTGMQHAPSYGANVGESHAHLKANQKCRGMKYWLLHGHDSSRQYRSSAGRQAAYT
jgi:hypothetical protein